MSNLRFPNPGSDADRLINTFRIVAEAASVGGVEYFDLDFMVSAVTAQGQASSQGASGATAVTRSTRPDRSRDPLYNQLKMYSELYRLLGWVRPHPAARLKFKVSVLGNTVSEDAKGKPALQTGLFRESLLATVFPNQVSNNLGVASSRPFSWLLQLAQALGGKLTRHEIILGVLAVTDDRSTTLSAVAHEIEQLRAGKVEGLLAAVAEFALAEGVQPNTLENYTRFPVGVLKSTTLNWGKSTRITGLYAKSPKRTLDALELTAFGQSEATRLVGMRDLRETDLSSLTIAERADLARLAYYVMLSRAGLKSNDLNAELQAQSSALSQLLRDLAVTSPDSILYSPFVQEQDVVLKMAES